MVINFPEPNEKQKLFLEDKHKYVAFGGARGGGKSWAVRVKAVLLSLKYSGIKLLIIRRTYSELVNNHINILRSATKGIARYNDKDKVLRFYNGSTIKFMYCARDADLERLQGTEWDVIFLDEACQLSEKQMTEIAVTCRGVNDFPKRIYFTCNPGGQGHGYIKRLFIDRAYKDSENPDDYAFIQSLVTDNKALMESQPEYIKYLEVLPPKMKKAWLYGDWNIFEGQFFEDFVDDDKHYDDKRFTHVINPFEVPKGWQIYRSFDFGYSKPFDCSWWAIDYDGRAYLILQLYGCAADQPNEGLKWSPDKIFEEIHRIETEHRWLKGKDIIGVADPAIWDASHGESINETAARYYVYFQPGDNKRLPGWMQIHYRFQFDENGYPMVYFFNTCKAAIRTLPLLLYSETHPEDLDTNQEDHFADSFRYFCMSRPIKPMIAAEPQPIEDDPLDLRGDNKRYARYQI